MLNITRPLGLIFIGLSLIGAGEPRQPTAQWVANFDDSECRASRNYGTTKNPTLLFLKVPPTGDVIQIAFITREKKQAPKQVDAEIILDQRPPLRMSMLVF